MNQINKIVPQSERIHADEITYWFDLFVGVNKKQFTESGEPVRNPYAVIWDDGTNAALVIEGFRSERGARRFYNQMVRFLTLVGLPMAERGCPTEIADCVRAAASHARKVRWLDFEKQGRK